MDKYFEILPNPKISEPYYEINLKWDANDGDYILNTRIISKKAFEEDETLQLVLSYIGHGYFGELFDNGWNGSQYGHHVIDTKIKGLIDFITANKLESRDIYSEICHSVCEVTITYFDEYNTVYNVQLVNFDTLYSTGEKAIEDLENKIEAWFEERIKRIFK